MKYADFYKGRVHTIVLSQEVQDYLQHPRHKNFAKKAEPYLRRLADRGKEGMTDPETFRHEGEGIWALKPQPVRSARAGQTRRFNASEPKMPVHALTKCVWVVKPKASRCSPKSATASQLMRSNLQTRRAEQHHPPPKMTRRDRASGMC